MLLAGAMSQTASFGGPLEKIPQSVMQMEEHDGPPLLEVKVDTSYNIASETEFRGRNYGESDAFNYNLSASSFLMLSERWLMPLELQSQNFILDNMPGVPMPDSINMLELGTGLAYLLNDKWLIMGRFNTALYKFDDISSDDIGFSGGIMIEWQYSPTLKWVFGAMYQPDNDLPVIPLVGAEWMINEDWELHVTFPQPRLIYSPGDRWRFHVGMDLHLGTTFHTSDTLGTSVGMSEFNNVLGSYSDIRVGGGIGYQLTEALSLEAEGGYSMNREIDYPDIDEKVKFDSTPYFRVGLRLEF